MPADRILVIDAGTSALRAIAVAKDGRTTPLAAVPWPMFVPDDAAPFGREFDHLAVASALSSLIDQHAGDVAAISFTGQREGLVFLDDRGGTLLASPNIDARASAEGMAIDGSNARDVYAVTGHLPSLMQAPAKYAWLRAHRPDRAARTAHVLPLADWLATLAGGEPAMSRTLAAENGLLDVRTGVVCGDLLSDLALPIAFVPPMRCETSRFTRARPIVLAGADTQCALVGMGVATEGVGVPAGWSAPLQMVTERPMFDVSMRTWTSVHVAPDRWILESNASETGRAWDWICGMMGVAAIEADALAAQASLGSGDVMSILGARTMTAAAMNAGVGAVTLPLPLVMSSPDRGALLRSVLEATAYAIRSNLEQLEEVAAATIPRLHLGGGMSRSALFAQIVADVIDRPVEVATTPETSALGAAALAATAIGWYSSLDAAATAMCGGRRILEPDARFAAEYEDYYGRWCAMSDAMEGMGHL